MKKLVFAAFFAVCSVGFASSETNLVDSSDVQIISLAEAIGVLSEVNLEQGFKSSKVIYNNERQSLGNCDFIIVTSTRHPDGTYSDTYNYFSVWAMSKESCDAKAAASTFSGGRLRYSHYSAPFILGH